MGVLTSFYVDVQPLDGEAEVSRYVRVGYSVLVCSLRVLLTTPQIPIVTISSPDRIVLSLSNRFRR